MANGGRRVNDKFQMIIFKIIFQFKNSEILLSFFIYHLKFNLISWFPIDCFC